MLYTEFDNKTIIKGTLTAIDPIHIGAASKDSLDPTELDSPVLKDSFGNPIIPGSSLKGVVRSRFEAIMRSIGVKACDINENKKNCMNEDAVKAIKNDKSLSLIDKAQLYYDKSCEVCKLFGGRQFAGKVQIKDCYYIGDSPCLYEKRDGVGIDRKTGAAKRGAKYDFEIIPKGTKFDFELIAENLDEIQKKYLKLILDMLCGIGITDDDYISVGGKTTRGLGRIKLDIIENNTVTSEDYCKRINAFLNGEELT